MEIFRIPAQVDVTRYKSDEDQLETKYGLPSEVKFCKSCVISNQRPNSALEYLHTQETKKATINFDADGICDACRATEQKNRTTDWKEREQELVELCNKHRRKDGYYDCLVPGSGGKDSFYAAHILKNEYGMHPLTVTWAAHIYTDWGWGNLQSWIHAGFDNYLMTPNGQTHRLLTRLALEKLFHPFQPFIFGQKSLAPRMASLLNIPLVFYGENETEYGNPLANAADPQQDQNYFAVENKNKICLGGVSISDLKKYFGVEEQDLLPYMPSDPNQLKEKNIEVHYLGYYLKWHPQSCYYYAVEHGNFKASPERTPGTYSKYNSIDDRIDDFHYYSTSTKFGIGRATYDAAQEIRSGDITREEGVALVKRFDHEFPERFADEIFQYLSLPPKEFPVASKMFEQPIMNREYFLRLQDNFRSPHLWKFEENKWKLRHAVWHKK